MEACAVLVVVAACSSTPPPLSAPPPSITSSPTSQSPRGLLVKTIGQTAGFSNEKSGALQAGFTLDASEVDPTCT